LSAYRPETDASCQYVARDCGSHILSLEHPGNAKASNVDRHQREDVPMRQLVVPWRAGPSVAEVVACHILVAGKPSGVIR
jgi:hypothetical protein